MTEKKTDFSQVTKNPFSIIYGSLFTIAAKLRLRSFYHFLVDKIEGIDTAGDIPQNQLSDTKETNLKYGPGGWWDLKITLGKVDTRNDVFIDMGSGKGRMIYLAARKFSFKKIIGVEISGKLNEIAQNNIERNKRKLKSTDIQIITSDVSNYQIPDDATIIYLYDPFRGEVFINLIKKLRDSLNNHPRVLRIIYRNPVMHDYLIENGFSVVLSQKSLIMYSGK
jgi:hypothetical protein